MGINDFNGSRIGACCKNCEERYPACHDTCDKYQTALAEWKEFKGKVYNANKLDVYDQYKIETIRQRRRRRQKNDWYS